MNRLLTVVVLLVVVAALAVGGFVAIDRLAGDDPEEVVIDKPELTATPIVVTDLIERETFEGTLRFRDAFEVTSQLAGTVTAVPEAGTVVDRGDRLVEVDGHPVVVLFGDRPMWRPLAEGIDEGEDVRQLEENLVALGYAPDGGFTPDAEFDEDTADMVVGWHEDLGLSDDPIVELGRIVYLQEPARVGSVLVTEGAPLAPGTPIVELSSTDKEVSLLLPVDRQDLVMVGDEVDVVLPDDVLTTGVVEEIGRVVVTTGGPGSDERAVEVIVALADPGVGGDLDQAPVDVELEAGRAAGVLAVPVNALLALADGGYALQLERPGEPELVAVEIGTFVGGLVEISGDVEAGDMVLVPK